MKTPANNNTSSAQVPQFGTPIRTSTNPAIHVLDNPTQSPGLFNQPGILEQIGRGRIAKFLNAFADELLPVPLLSTLKSSEPSTDWPAEVAKLLASTKNLPEPLQHAMSTLEAAAAPENGDRLDGLIQRHVPNVSLNRSCPLDCALELRFITPEALECFACISSSLATPKSDEGGSPSSSSSISGVSAFEVPGSTVPGSTVAVSCVPSVPFVPADDTGTKHPASSDKQPTTNHEPLTTDDGLLITDNGLPITNCQPQSTDEAAIRSLASLSPMDYDRTRKKSARELGIRVETLDAEVARLRNQLHEDAMLQSALATLRSPEPWPEPVNGAELLSQVSNRFSRHLALPPGAAPAFALWSAQSHCFSAFMQTPRLSLHSPKPGCGKTTALDILATMTPRALRTENLTAPVLFRLVDQYQPTLLLDEVDSWLPQAEELRGLLNAGHKRGACAYRCDGENNAVRPFKAFAPAVLAGIGQLPGTLLDRSISIPLVQAEPDQLPARFDDHHTEIETELCRKLARWAADNFAALKACDPPLPATAFNRLADNWRPLFAIAQIAAGDWPRLALESFKHLAPSPRTHTPTHTLNLLPPHPSEGESTASPIPPSIHQSINPSIQLLTAIRRAFAQSNATRLSIRQLAEALNHFQAGFFSPKSLARRLRELGLEPRPFRVAGSVFKGYELADFSRHFEQSNPPNDPNSQSPV